MTVVLNKSVEVLPANSVVVTGKKVGSKTVVYATVILMLKLISRSVTVAVVKINWSPGSVTVVV